MFLRDRILRLHLINHRIQVVHRVEIADQAVLLADLNALWLAVLAVTMHCAMKIFNSSPGATALDRAFVSLNPLPFRTFQN